MPNPCREGLQAEALTIVGGSSKAPGLQRLLAMLESESKILAQPSVGTSQPVEVRRT